VRCAATAWVVCLERQLMSRQWRWCLVFAAVLVFSTSCLAQNKLVKRALVINGHSGEVTIFRVDGHPFVDLETLVKIGNGSVRFEGNSIILTFDFASNASPAPCSSVTPAGPSNAMSPGFMNAAVEELAILKEWRSYMAYGITRGVPGDGSRMVLNQNKATDALRLAQVAVSSDADRSVFELLRADFDHVNSWYKQLVEGRKNMATGNYSMSEDSLKTDSAYQKIVSCSDFLGTMIPSGTFSDDGSCQ
jgi:hypothetical protein